MRSLARRCAKGAGLVALIVLAAVADLSACARDRCADAPPYSSLPIIECDPLPPGSPGCLGEPPATIPADAGIDAKVYPARCQAIVASGLSDSCGSELWLCQQLNQQFEWEPAGR
jgi:hypothetical protein